METRRYARYEQGMKFGKLTLLERLPGGQKWRCICDCGNEVITQIAGGARACYRCAHQDCNLRHGHNRSVSVGRPDRIYRIWIGMKSRCNNPNDTGYSYYGSRGISVCDSWNDDFASFYEWAMAHGYTDDLTIDRINVDGDYEPCNCRWIPMVEQARNKRKRYPVI